MAKRAFMVGGLMAAGIALGLLLAGLLARRADAITNAMLGAGPEPAVGTAPTLPAVAERPASISAGIPDARRPEIQPQPAEPTLPGPRAADPVPRLEMRTELKVGVVNLELLFDETKYALAKLVTDQLKEVQSDIQKDIQGVEARMAILQKDIEAIPDHGNPLHQKKVLSYKLAEAELDVSRKMGRARFLARYNELKLAVYAEVRRVIDIFAKERKYDLILRVEEPQLEEDVPENIGVRIGTRVVLMAADSLDVTADVLKLLNEEYVKAHPKKNEPDK